MADSDSIVSQAATAPRFMPPEELALQNLTKQLYKSRLFRGFYTERCYVEQVRAYRDVIVLQRSERELEKLLLSSAGQLQLFYQRIVPNMWVGITKGSVGNYKHAACNTQLDTGIWTELSGLAFGEYWFSIKTLRFRDQEVQIKLKMIRPVEPEMATATATPRRSLSQSKRNVAALTAAAGENAGESSTPTNTQQPSSSSDLSAIITNSTVQIGIADFISLLQQWGDDIKTTVYNFMANDVNKNNIVGTIRFLGLLIISTLSGAIVALRFLGIFVLRLLFELSRFTHSATPIIFKLIDFVNKICGAFFILLTMIWKDLIVNRGSATTRLQPAALDDRNRRYKSITYEPHRGPRGMEFRN